MKPLGRKAYGSIGHLPGSRLGPGDHCISEGQARICTEKARDKHDIIIVQAKLDGSCCAVVKLNGEIIPLSRAGYAATTSPHKQHHIFAAWVRRNEQRFRGVLKEGERIVGEWLAQAHGTIYDLSGYEPFFPFDLMRGTDRATHIEFIQRVAPVFSYAPNLHIGGPLPVQDALVLHDKYRLPPCDKIEGVVYRVERRGKVDFLCKFVCADKVDGCYLDQDIWNWRMAA